MAAMMSGVMNSDKVAEYIELARCMGIEVLGPDINISTATFYVQNGAIRFGLAAVKNIGEAMINSVVKIREQGGTFKSLLDFCLRIDQTILSKRSIESLIKCGAFDSIDKRRTTLLANLETAFAEGQQKKLDNDSGQVGLFGDKDKSDIFKMVNVPEKSKRELLDWEYETLGFYISGHPLDEYIDKIKDLRKIRDLHDGVIVEGKLVKIAGLIVNLRQRTMKNGETMCFMDLEDFNDKINVTVFASQYRQSAKNLYVGNVIILQGRVETSNDDITIIANNIISAEDYTPDYYLTITDEFDKPETYMRLKNISNNNHGQRSVFTNKNGKWQNLGSEYAVAYGKNVTAAFESVIGIQNVRKY